MPPRCDAACSTTLTLTLLSPSRHSHPVSLPPPHHRHSSPSLLSFLCTSQKLSIPPFSRLCHHHHHHRHRHRLQLQLTTPHRVQTKIPLRAGNPAASDSMHPPTIASSSSESLDTNPDDSQASSLQCFGTGPDVECVTVPNNRNGIVNLDLDARVSRNDGDDQTSMQSKTWSIASDEKQLLLSDRNYYVKSRDMECIGTGTDVECVIVERRESNVIEGNTVDKSDTSASFEVSTDLESVSLLNGKTKNITSPSPSTVPLWLKEIWESAVLISPFFFWGTAMVAMKGVLPKAGSLFVASTRLIPSGFLLIGFATFQNRKQPSGLNAWFAITLFALVDAACFQGFLAEGLRRTSAGLGSVIIDSQPLSVAVLASIFFGETIGAFGVLGLATGVIGLLLLEVPPQVIGEFFKGNSLLPVEGLSAAASSVNGWNIWDSGEWWMLLAAQSMAVGTVMVRWLCQFADPVMATGWHMVIGGIPLLALAIIQHDPALSGHIQDLQPFDWLALVYVSVFGSAVSYGVFFYNASRGSLTKLSSLTFLTPMFAALFGYILLDETLNPVQIVGAVVTLASIYLINKRTISNNDEDAKT